MLVEELLQLLIDVVDTDPLETVEVKDLICWEKPEEYKFLNCQKEIYVI